jgi:hypothetical protein
VTDSCSTSGGNRRYGASIPSAEETFVPLNPRALRAALVVATAFGLTTTAALPAHAAPAPPQVVETYVTPVVVLGTVKAHDSTTAAAVRGATSVTVSGDRTTAGLCAGYDEKLIKSGPADHDPTITVFGSVSTLAPSDFRDIGGNGCAGRWKLSYAAKGDGGTTKGTAYQYLLRDSRFGAFNAAPEPIRAGTPVTSTGVLQRASWADLRYHAWVTPVKLQFRGAGGWKTYRTLTPNSSGVVRGTVTQKISGCWRMVAVGTSTTDDAVSPVDCVRVR